MGPGDWANSRQENHAHDFIVSLECAARLHRCRAKEGEQHVAKSAQIRLRSCCRCDDPGRVVIGHYLELIGLFAIASDVPPRSRKIGTRWLRQTSPGRNT